MKIFHPNTMMTFGKYKNYFLKDVYQYEPSYIEFMIREFEDVVIDIEQFRKLPVPTPYLQSYATEHSSMKVVKLRENQIPNALKYIAEGNIIASREFIFSEELIQINANKVLGIFKKSPKASIQSINLKDIIDGAPNRDWNDFLEQAFKK